MTRTEEQHTAATQHPEWNGIVSDIEGRFATTTVQAWCIRAVGAYLLGVHDTAKQVLLCLGETLANALVEICEHHGVDLRSLNVSHVRS